MAPSRNKGKMLPAPRFGLTHGPGVPKIIQENSEQFFAPAIKRKPKIIPTSKPIISTEFQRKPIISTEFQYKPIILTEFRQKQNNKKNVNEKREESYITSIQKPLSPIIILPPIRTTSNRRPKTTSTTSICTHHTTLRTNIPSPCDSLGLSTPPLIESLRSFQSSPKHQSHSDRRVDQDIFRKAYERALSVARSRLLFHDPYSLTRSGATHGILYSYYDHTPMCIFSRGAACNHRQDKQERITKLNIFRKKIFNDVTVEDYIRKKKEI
jgi:hypothetical protein